MIDAMASRPSTRDPTRSIPLLAFRLLALLGLATSALLWTEYAAPTPQLCVGGGGCDAVRHSSYSSLAGIPMPVLGVTAFLGAFFASFSRGSRAPRVVLAVGVVAGLAGLALLALQAFAIGAFCPYCVVADLSALGLLVAAFLQRRRVVAGAGPAALGAWGAAAAGALVVPLLLGGGARAEHAEPPRAVEVSPPPMTWAPAMTLAPASPVSQPPLPDPIAREQREGVVTIVEFLDFECPYCRKLQALFERVLPDYGHRVRVVRKHLPLPQHEHAEAAARAAACAEELNPVLGERMAAALLTASDVSAESCERIALRIGLDRARLRECVASERATLRLERDRADAAAAGVRGLPTFWIGSERYSGLIEESTLRASLERALAATAAH